MIFEYFYPVFVLIAFLILAFFSAIGWLLYHVALKDWLWCVDSAMNKMLFWFLDRVLGNIEYDWRKME